MSNFVVSSIEQIKHVTCFQIPQIPENLLSLYQQSIPADELSDRKDLCLRDKVSHLNFEKTMIQEDEMSRDLYFIILAGVIAVVFLSTLGAFAIFNAGPVLVGLSIFLSIGSTPVILRKCFGSDALIDFDLIAPIEALNYLIEKSKKTEEVNQLEIGQMVEELKKIAAHAPEIRQRLKDELTRLKNQDEVVVSAIDQVIERLHQITPQQPHIQEQIDRGLASAKSKQDWNVWIREELLTSGLKQLQVTEEFIALLSDHKN